MWYETVQTNKPRQPVIWFVCGDWRCVIPKWMNPHCFCLEKLTNPDTLVRFLLLSVTGCAGNCLVLGVSILVWSLFFFFYLQWKYMMQTYFNIFILNKGGILGAFLKVVVVLSFCQHLPWALCLDGMNRAKCQHRKGSVKVSFQWFSRKFIPCKAPLHWVFPFFQNTVNHTA